MKAGVNLQELDMLPARERWLYEDDRDDREIRLGFTVPEVWPDADLASQELRLAPERVAVQMLPSAKESRGVILIEDGRTEEFNIPDVGIVLAAGNEVGTGPHDRWRYMVSGNGCPDSGIPIPLNAGDLVLVHSKHGTWIDSFYCRRFNATGQVRIYGQAVPIFMETEALMTLIPWERSILAKLHETETGYDIEPLGDNIIVERPEINDLSPGGIALLDQNTWAEPIGIVRAVGPKVQNVKVGQTWLYVPTAMRRIRELSDGSIRAAIAPESAFLTEM